MVDTETAISCIAAIDSDRRIPPGAVQVRVRDGWVTLTGEAHDRAEKLAARRAVASVDTVLGITDDIADADCAFTRDEVAVSIEKALRRMPFTDERLIDISVEGGTVYLDGSVGCRSTLREAEDAAWSTPGVVRVVNRLTATA
jgi:osmotically-inducible protein OsmY